MAAGFLVMFLFFLFIVRYNSVEGGMMSLSQEEDLELEKQLKLRNKQANTTITTDLGKIYDCVDFYKQPAFDHPLLKNHSYNFQMKPLFPTEKSEGISPSRQLNLGLKDGGCPIGTVPIQRTTKEDLIREKLALSSRNSGGTYTAVIHTKNGAKLTGALGFLSVHNPPAQGSQYSSSRIKIQNGNEFLEFGWRVDPALYGDSLTHLYIETNINSGRCFDTSCGFVVTNTNPNIGLPTDQISVPGKYTVEIKFRVQRDQDGNWWLSEGVDNVQIGFWPSKLFTQLTQFATYVDWGGEVFSPPNVAAPPMGTGIAPWKRPDNLANAYIRWVTAINLRGNDFNPKTAKFGTDKDGSYNVIDNATKDRVWGHIVWFGGNKS